MQDNITEEGYKGTQNKTKALPMKQNRLQEKVWLLALTTGRMALNFMIIAGVVGICALLLWFLQQIHLIASILAVSILAAYVLSPAVNFFCQPLILVIPEHCVIKLPFFKEKKIPLKNGGTVIHLTRKGLPKIASISLVYCILLVLLAISLTYVIPVVTAQFQGLTRNLETIVSNLQSNIAAGYHWLRQHTPTVLMPFVNQINPESISLESWAEELQSQIPDMLGSTAHGLFSGMKIAAGVVTSMVLVPLFTFYLLLDGDRYSQAAMRMVPRRWKSDVSELLSEIDLMLGRYIRGQLIVCVTIGLAIAIALNLLGVEYATLIGVFAGIVDVIPYVGVAIGLIPAFLIALVNHGFLFALLVVVVLEIIHWLEGHLVVPAVIGHSVGLPPLIVMIALGAGYELGGIMGMVLAIPTAAIIRVLGNYYAERLNKLESLTESPAPEGPPPRTGNTSVSTPSSELDDEPSALHQPPLEQVTG